MTTNRRQKNVRRALVLLGISDGRFKHPHRQPTPVGHRSHTFRESKANYMTFGMVRPSAIGKSRYGIKDLGWKPVSAYVRKDGQIKQMARA